MKRIMIVCSALLLFLPGCMLPKVPYVQPDSGPLTGKEIRSPAFSPDGKEIVFSLCSKTTCSIHKINVDGTNLTVLGSSGGFDSSPVYTPDGRTIVFSSYSGGKQADLFLMKTDGTGKSNLTTGPHHDFYPAISPDGLKVYFVRAEFFGNYSPIAAPSWHENDIYSVNIDGTGLTRITHKRFYRLTSLSVHPDGRRLLARIPNHDKAHSIWTISMENPTDLIPLEPDLGQHRTILSSLGGSSGNYADLHNPMFSPDGTSLLFTWRRSTFGGAKEGIFLMDLETGRTSKVADLASLLWGGPSLSHDGSRIVFSTLEHDPLLRSIPKLWIVNSDGTSLRVVNF